MDDPDSVEMNEELEEGAFFFVGLEERAGPVDLVEFHEALSGRDVHESALRT